MTNSEHIGLRMPELDDMFETADYVFNWETIDAYIFSLQSQTGTLTATDNGAGTVTISIKGAEQ